MAKSKPLKLGELYTFRGIQSKPIFDNSAPNRFMTKILESYVSFVLLEKEEKTLDKVHKKVVADNGYSWYKILTAGGDMGWIFSHISALKRVK